MRYIWPCLIFLAAQCPHCCAASGLEIIGDFRSGTQATRVSPDHGNTYSTLERKWDADGQPVFWDPRIGPPPLPHFIESAVPGPFWGVAKARAINSYGSELTQRFIKVESSSGAESYIEFPGGKSSATSISNTVLRYRVDLPGRYVLVAQGGAAQEWCTIPSASTSRGEVKLEASNGEVLYTSTIQPGGATSVNESRQFVFRPELVYTLTVKSTAQADIDIRREGLRTTNHRTGVSAHLYQIGGFCPADLNRDMVIDQVDLLMLLSLFGTSPTPFGNGDLSGDGVINTNDLALMLGRYQTSC